MELIGVGAERHTRMRSREVAERDRIIPIPRHGIGMYGPIVLLLGQ